MKWRLNEMSINLNSSIKQKKPSGSQIYHIGYADALNNAGNQSSNYKGHDKKCYQNGYKEGQLSRAIQKKK